MLLEPAELEEITIVNVKKKEGSNAPQTRTQTHVSIK